MRSEAARGGSPAPQQPIPGHNRIDPDSPAAGRPQPGGQPPGPGSGDRPPLEAILLVGGQGTRLRPLTVDRPKQLVPCAGAPFLAHQLARAAASGITRVILATCFRAELFAEAFGDGSVLGLELDYVQEDVPLGTGGGIRNAAAGLRSGPEDPVVVLNGDLLSGHDLSAQLDMHSKADAAVTLHLEEVDDPSRFGCVPTDDSGRVTAFLEKTPHPVTNRVNAGCYVFRRRIIDQIPAGAVVSVERETFPALIAAGELIMGYAETAYWLDVGTPEAFVQGSRDLVLGELSSAALPGRTGDLLALPGARIDPAATVTGGTVVGAGCTVAGGAEIDGSVLMDGAAVAAGARVRASIVGIGARIGPGVILDSAVIGDGAEIMAGNELRCGARVWPGVRLSPTAVRFSTDA
ncbi:MAG TPA: NDP-sugar synthase [Streptosporangiaceae bacterium]|jgi:mannose-1-phosphate guanylyltransferase